MRGRPKMEDSRDRQYRVRLNTEEEKMLEYVSGLTGKQRSEIFRKALEEYYHKVRVLEYTQEDGYNDGWDMEGISLKRVIECPYCGAKNGMDFSEDYTSFSEERQMGEEITYSFEWEGCTCYSCGKTFNVSGYICEYPIGVYNYEQIHIGKNSCEEN